MTLSYNEYYHAAKFNNSVPGTLIGILDPITTTSDVDFSLTSAPGGVDANTLMYAIYAIAAVGVVALLVVVILLCAVIAFLCCSSDKNKKKRLYCFPQSLAYWKSMPTEFQSLFPLLPSCF